MSPDTLPYAQVRASLGGAYFGDRQNHLRDVAGGIVSLPRPLTQVLWRGRTEEHKERHGGLVPGYSVLSRLLLFLRPGLHHPVAEAGSVKM